MTFDQVSLTMEWCVVRFTKIANREIHPAGDGGWKAQAVSRKTMERAQFFTGKV
jgi:hypothetical protein